MGLLRRAAGGGVSDVTHNYQDNTRDKGAWKHGCVVFDEN